MGLLLLSNWNSIINFTTLCRISASITFFAYLAGTQNIDVPEVTFIEGTINETVNHKVGIEAQVILYYKINDSIIPDPANIHIRIRAEVLKSPVSECPLLFSIRETQAVVSWQLPVVNGDSYYIAERTLCINSTRKSLNQTILIAISTCNVSPIDFSVYFRITNDTIIEADSSSSTEVTISPTSPEFYTFNYPPGIEYVMITLNSDDKTCMTFSIQAPSCPVFDQAEHIQFQGYSLTLTTQASLTIRRKHYPDGFHLVFVVLYNNTPCQTRSEIAHSIPSTNNLFASTRNKTLSFNIHSVIEPYKYVTPIVVPLVVIFLVLLIICVVFSKSQKVLLSFNQSVNVSCDVINNDASEDEPSGLLQGRGASFQSNLNLDDLKERTPHALQKQSNRYIWFVVISGIFYCVPAFQLIINYLKVLHRTRDYDLCYYNYLCARPLGCFIDFNHIYSNIGYVIFGLCFLIFVRKHKESLITKLAPTPSDDSSRNVEISEVVENTEAIRNVRSDSEFGTLQHSGIYYALGVALMVEGVLSAAYHVCPNQSNFQFDTLFMYVIAQLGIVKVYQFRHPVYFSANITFISLAFVAALSVFGLLLNYLILKICFSVIQIFGIVSILLYNYNLGLFTKDDDSTVVTGWLDIYRCVFGRSKYIVSRRESCSKTSGVTLSVLTMLLNIIVMIWTIMRENFATQLLAVFVVNFLVYTFYYGIMKKVHNEYKDFRWIQSAIYATFAICLWIPSLYFFFQAVTSWEASPAESRALNHDCILLSFFDNHDMWHFTSSAALFCSFMLLLTIDDDLIATKHKDIPVF